MVRSNHQLDERMTLIWHDWFATSNDGVGNQKLMVAQNEMLRQKCLGSFRGLLYNVTVDPAMLVWLSGDGSDKRAPNENYGREMMELFTLGAGARYTETDVREQARALTGFTSDWSEAEGQHNFHFEDKRHDNDPKTIFGKTGNFGWQDSCNLCIDHPDHAAFFVQKLWSYFVPVPLTGKNLKAFISLYKRKGYRVRPVVQAILMHPAFYKGPGMIKPPIVFTAGLLRAQNAGITSDAWAWLSEQTGQRLFYPPNVAGWDDDAWLDTGRFRGRWNVARHATEDVLLDPGDNKDAKNWDPDETPEQAYKNVMNFWGNPIVNGPDPRCTDGLCAQIGPAGRQRQMEEEALPRDASERDAHPPGDEPRSTDFMSANNAHNACEEFNRAQLLRDAAATAGNGLPAIEAGMPAPAGTGLSRRQFLLRSGAFSLTIYGAMHLNALGLGEAIANAAAGPPQPILVSVFLDGGADSLSILAPVEDPIYRQLRPTLALPGRRRNRVRRRHPSALEPRRRLLARSSRREQARRRAVGRIRPPGPVPLHVPPLLGSRRARHAPADRLAGSLPRRGRQPRQPASGALARLQPGPIIGAHQGTGRSDLAAELLPL